MSNQLLIQFFKNTNLVTQLTAEEIAKTFSSKEIKKNDFLFREGRVCNEYYFLEKGFIRAFAYDTGGNDVTTNFYSSGQVVFEVSSFFNRTITKDNYQAIMDCEGWFITYDQLNNLEVERRDTGTVYNCVAGHHDDLAISCAMLAWAARHQHLPFWVRTTTPKVRIRRDTSNWAAGWC